MMQLDGHQRNTIQMTNNLGSNKATMNIPMVKKVVQLPNLGLFGMKHLATIMMLLQASTMMQTLVSILFVAFY